MGSRRYDSRTTIFSPEGRLYQVEYALEAISHAGTAIGILAKDGIVLAAERKVTSKLLEHDVGTEKLYKLNDNSVCAVAGIDSDANILVNNARVYAQNYLKTYGEEVPVELLVEHLCYIKQGYTQHGGLRPFGVSFIYAGWDDRRGFQLYTSNPSGNYAGWKACSVGANNASAQTLLKQEYKAVDKAAAESEDVEDLAGAPSGLTLTAASEMALKVLSKTMDSATMTSDKLEFATVSLTDGEKVSLKVWKPTEITALLKSTGIGKVEQKEDE